MKQLNSLRTGSSSVIWELFKAMYGLKQAPCAWTRHLAGKLVGAGWVQLDADPSLWIMKNAAREIIVALLCYVDDMQMPLRVNL